MKIKGDYHTHTIYSWAKGPKAKHAKGTIRENVEIAYEKGLEEIAITEHGPGHYIYGVNRKYFKDIRDEIDRLNEEYNPKGLKILMGLEANIIGLDGELDIDEDDLKYLDLLLMGYHYGARPNNIKDGMGLYILNPISKYLLIGKEKAIELNTEAYLKAMDRYDIDIITHPGSKAPILIEEVAKKAIKKDTILEISTKHSELSVESLEKIKDLDGLRCILNSDAHKSEDVGNVKIGYEKALSSGMDLEKIVNLI